MPQISLNLKPPNGLSSHQDLILHQATQSLSTKPGKNSDLIIVPRSGTPLVSHQAVLSSMSPLLATLFQQFTCTSDCVSKETLTVHLDLDHVTVESILKIIYTGKAVLDTTVEVDCLKTGLDLLGININLGEESPHSQLVSNSTPLTPLSSALFRPLKSSRKRSLSTQPTTPSSAKRAKVSTTNVSDTNDLIDCRPTMFECNNCDMNFKFRKGLKSHNQRNHEQDNNGQSKLANYVASIVDDSRHESSKHSKQIEITSFFSLQQSKTYPQLKPPSQTVSQSVDPSLPSLSSCLKCNKTFPFESLLLQHLACVHYAKQLLQVYPDQACSFSSCQHAALNNILKLEHIARSHQSSVNFLLQSEGLSPIPPVPEDSLHAPDSIIFLTPTCQLCPQSTSSPQALAIHYMTEHYADQVESWTKSPCQLCGALFYTGTMGVKTRMLQHLALRHTGLVVRFMERDGLWLGKEEVYREGECGYKTKAIRVELKKIVEPSLVREISQIKANKLSRKKSVSKKKKKETSEGTLSLTSHVKEENSTENIIEQVATPSLECFLCDADHTAGGMISLLNHMSDIHYRLEIERTYMTRPGAVWALRKQCPLCDEVVEDWEVFIKHIGVEHRAVEQFMPEKFRFTNEASTIKSESMPHSCILPDCSRQYPNERSLLVHLVMSHYYKQMEDMFEDKFLADTSSCFKCRKTLPSNKVGFMKHLGVDHGVVMELATGTFDLEKFSMVGVKKEL